jgi:hydroxyethylthiazole kinase-like uncharacterized protein yjeF
VRPLLSPDEMRRADAAAIAAGTSEEVLMERAGEAVARAALRLAGGRYGRRAVIVCGRGNNGGDGFVAARRLAREGMGVRCLLVGDLGSPRGAAAVHLERLRRAGVAPEPFDAGVLGAATVVVDALFGTGFRGAATGDAAEAITAVNDVGAPVVAVDIPSGVDGNTGRAAGPAVHADVTVALAAEKLGTALSEGAVRAGSVEVVDIGIPVRGARAWWPLPADVAGVLPRRRPDAHKRSGGAMVVLAGSAGMTGAALMTCRGALRAGAGYVTLGATPAVDTAKSALLPEVVSLRVSDRDELGPAALDRFGAVLDRADALALGPGLGRGDAPRRLVVRALREVMVPVVLDADGLNVLSGDTTPLERRAAVTVLTPHPVELARLLDCDVTEIESDRPAAARRAAERWRCVVLLKGWRTVVAQPSGGAVVNPTGGPELATAGTGDVLTGVVGALLAAGLEGFDAAWAAAYVHGAAGGLAARSRGSGVVAWDVAESLPAARGALGGAGAARSPLRPP